jgi:predicted RNA-binding Zn-ribbon protein involved in translation (DUF1610 family)
MKIFDWLFRADKCRKCGNKIMDWSISKKYCPKCGEKYRTGW